MAKISIYGQIMSNNQLAEEIVKVTFDDNTDLKAVEEALREANERLSAIVLSSPIGIIVLDTKGIVASWNPAAEKIFGWKAEEVMGFPYPLMPGTQAEEEDLRFYNRVMQGEHLFNIKVVRRNKQGNKVDVSLSASPLHDSEGKKIGILVMLQDISEAKKAQKILQKFRLLSENARDIILFVRRRDGAIVEANSKAVHVYGYTREELLKKTIFELRPDEAGLVQSQMTAAHYNGILFETVHCRKDGTIFPVEVSSQGVDMGEEAVLLSIIRDITERKQAEEKLREANKQLEESNYELARLGKYKSEILANVSHELRTPLTAILAFSGELLAQQSDLKPDQIRFLKDIQDSGQMLMNLINDLLELSKAESNKIFLDLAEIRVGDIVRDVLRSLRPLAASKDIETRFHLIDRRSVIADADKVRQVVQNLIGNALKFSPRGSLVEIEVCDTCSSEEGILLTVKDNGPGIPTEHHSLIFDAFYQVDSGRHRQFPGTGLGLALVKKIVDMHLGRVELKSKVGEGSTFSVFWPAYPALDKDIE